jgi:cyclopropane-fatty-acyl-phospholipid synthase
MATRGHHLVHADRRFATASGLIARLAAPAAAQILAHIDRGLERGGIVLTTPGGSVRRLGFRRPGPEAFVSLESWMALVRLALSGSVGWYRAWADGLWSSPDPVPVFELFSLNARPLGDIGRAKGPFRVVNAIAHRLRDNRPRTARANIAAHYDLGNDFYSAWLDETMTYSSARFRTPFVPSEVEGPVSPSLDTIGAGATLESAQAHKIATLLDRLELRPGDRLLEIGCGWGSLAIAAARRGVAVVGLTLSKEQKAWAERRVAEEGLADRVDIRLQDYRETSECFDAVASVEMVEAVGERWWGAYLDCIARNLRPGGRAALQYILIDHAFFARYRRNADFIQTYIFPGGMLLDEPAFAELARERGLSWDDRHAFGADYALTLKLWRERYDAALDRGALPGFDAAFHDLWRYYLMYCEGGFRGGAIDVAQVTMVRA